MRNVSLPWETWTIRNDIWNDFGIGSTCCGHWNAIAMGNIRIHLLQGLHIGGILVIKHWVPMRNHVQHATFWHMCIDVFNQLVFRTTCWIAHRPFDIMATVFHSKRFSSQLHHPEVTIFIGDAQFFPAMVCMEQFFVGKCIQSGYFIRRERQSYSETTAFAVDDWPFTVWCPPECRRNFFR